ncbi:MAG TPA: penicillin-binding transpeptidase domain-containing protein [Candidatus Paceibacterota bacterium]|nr:penicillin-binding transpeptidase domain-containing protein [Verrucomicrobiota bacterium]HSA12362.1 penicillin-binding transpeptidase domain-containing protein [Candidatus Paceibacterota bacterium]
MLIFDQLKKDDPQLRLLAFVVLCAMGVLLIGLWWVQVVSARDYQANLQTQSFRTVRIPAVRGRILDRNGVVLAENRPTYNISLYLEELRGAFDATYTEKAARVRSELKRQQEELSRKLNRELTREERKQFLYTLKEKARVRREARYEVASNVVQQVSLRLRQPLSIDATNFARHYETRLALPYPVVTDLNSTQIARFEEQSTNPMGVDLEVQSTRFYPHGTTAAHVLGHLRRDDSSVEGEEAFFSFRLPDYRGTVGVEFGFDRALRGMAGAKSVLVNNMGYRQTENVWIPAEPGSNVVLTLDLRIQQAAEQALQVAGPAARGAAVVLDTRNGDVLALVSSPSFNPNSYIPSLSHAEWRHITELGAEKNRATQENYAAGSIFKPIIGLACLEAGLNRHATVHSPGYIYVGRKRFGDLVTPGDYDFRRAIKASCNAYFIHNGLHVAGISNIVELGQRFQLGKRTGLPTRQEVSGIFPSLKTVSSGWYDGDTGNLCIGQGQMAVTPIQMAVATAAIANGGKVLWPRLVDRIEPMDPMLGGPTNYFPTVRVRNELQVKPRNLEIVREAMLADVEDADGTGVKAAVPGLKIAGKTGTAQVKNAAGALVNHITWFISFAPYDQPRFAVVTMVEGGISGAATSAPIAQKIYTAIQACYQGGDGKVATMAQAL